MRRGRARVLALAGVPGLAPYMRLRLVALLVLLVREETLLRVLLVLLLELLRVLLVLPAVLELAVLELRGLELGVLVLRRLRVLLLVTGVRQLTLLGRMPVVPLVPVQGVLGVPRFGGAAPAILSHRSPRAARRRQRLVAAAPGSASEVVGDGCSNAVTSRGTLPYRDQTTTSTHSPGGLPDTRSVSRAFWRITTAAAWSMTARPFLAFLPEARSPCAAVTVVMRSSTRRTVTGLMPLASSPAKARTLAAAGSPAR